MTPTSRLVVRIGVRSATSFTQQPALRKDAAGFAGSVHMGSDESQFPTEPPDAAPPAEAEAPAEAPAEPEATAEAEPEEQSTSQTEPSAASDAAESDE